MKDIVTLTAEEAAEMLKISRYTLYELVKRGEIPAQRIGRQLRFDREVLNSYLKGHVLSPVHKTSERFETSPAQEDISLILRFIGSHDPILEILAKFLKYSAVPVIFDPFYEGSMDGLYALYKRKTDITGIHLWDKNTQEYNLPFVEYVLPGEEVTIVNLVQRVQGFIVPPGNPLNITGFEDIAKGGLRFINRQKGSGTRLRIDDFLHRLGIPVSSIEGYKLEEPTHFGVACRIANGEADVGIGVQSAAYITGLDFVPLFKERYDIVCLKEKTEMIKWQQLRSILNSTAFHNAVKNDVGYDVSLTGHEIRKVR